MEMSDEFAGGADKGGDGGGGDNSRKNLLIMIGGIVVALTAIVVLVVVIMMGGGDDNTTSTQPPPAGEVSTVNEEDVSTPTGTTTEPVDTQQPTPEPTQTGPGSSDEPTSLSTFVPPTPLINPATLTTRELVVRNYSKQELQRVLNDARHLELDPGTIAYLPIRLEEPVDGSPAYFSADRFFESLDIEIPDTFQQTIDPRFTLYAYEPTQEDAQTCRQALGRETTKCPGMRLGVVLQRKVAADSDPANLPVSSPQLIGSWIRNTDVSSFKPIILDDISFPNNRSFTSFALDVNGINYPILYLNLPHSATTLNFTEVSDRGLIIIATSTNSLYAVLNSFTNDYGE